MGGAFQGVQGATVLHCLARLYETAIQGATKGATKCNTGCYISQTANWLMVLCWIGLPGGVLAVNPSTLRDGKSLQKFDPSPTRQDMGLSANPENVRTGCADYAEAVNP